MLRRKKTKIATLIFVILIMMLNFSSIKAMSVGLYIGCPEYCHFTWPFFHASWIHLLINVWCLLGIVFIYDVSIEHILIAYSSSIFAPNLTSIPIIGISGICLFLMGYIMWQVKRKIYFNCYVVAFIGIGFIFNRSFIHIYSYIIGISYGYLWKVFKKY